MLGAFFLGARGLNMDVIFIDGELLSIGHAGGLPEQTFTIADTINSVGEYSPMHTPGYFVALHSWRVLVGNSVLALRAFSLLIGILTIAWTYRLGAEINSRLVGLIAAISMAVCWFLIDYFHAMRMYAVMATLGGMVVFFYARIMLKRRQPRLIDWFAMFVSSVIMLYTHVFAIIPLIGIGAYHLLFVRKDKHWLKLTGVMIAAGIAFLPWLPTMIVGQSVRADLSERALDWHEVVYVLPFIFSNGAVALFVIFGLLALIAAYKKVPGALFITVVLGVSLFALAMLNEITPLLSVIRLRYTLPIFPLFAVFMALGIVQLGRLQLGKRWRPMLPLAGAGVWLVLAGIGYFSSAVEQYYSTYDRELNRNPQFQKLIPVMRDYVREGELAIGYTWNSATLYITPHNHNMASYYLGSIGLDHLMIRLAGTARDFDSEAAYQQIVEVAPNHDVAWLFHDQRRREVPEGAQIRAMLEEMYVRCGEAVRERGVVLELFTTNSEICAARVAEADASL
jgi:hypothetical protein